jgi:hypothetical protein
MLFPARFPVPAPPVEPDATLPPRQERSRLPRQLCPVIAERARYESLRDLAIEFAVSHETIRAIVRRTQQSEVRRVSLAL